MLFVALIVLFMWLETKGWHHVPWEIAIPGGFALAGAIQLATGVPFSNLASRWDSLKGWQRSVFGMGLLFGVTVLIVFVAAMYVVYTGK